MIPRFCIVAMIFSQAECFLQDGISDYEKGTVYFGSLDGLLSWLQRYGANVEFPCYVCFKKEV